MPSISTFTLYAVCYVWIDCLAIMKTANDIAEDYHFAQRRLAEENLTGNNLKVYQKTADRIETITEESEADTVNSVSDFIPEL